MVVLGDDAIFGFPMVFVRKVTVCNVCMHGTKKAVKRTVRLLVRQR
jgi:hypothetical protein